MSPPPATRVWLDPCGVSDLAQTQTGAQSLLCPVFKRVYTPAYFERIDQHFGFPAIFVSRTVRVSIYPGAVQVRDWCEAKGEATDLTPSAPPL